MATNQDREWVATADPTVVTSRPAVVRPADPYDDAARVPGGTAVVARAPIVEDRLRWGAVWAGLLTALTVFVLLSLLGLAIGVSIVNGGRALATGKVPSDAGHRAAFWLGLSGVLSFLIGGYVAGRAGVVFTRGRAALHGSMVFVLALPLLVLLAGQYASGNLGGLGIAMHDNLGLLQTTATGATVRNAAWWTLIGLVVAWIASALGGACGARAPRKYR